MKICFKPETRMLKICNVMNCPSGGRDTLGQYETDQILSSWGFYTIIYTSTHIKGVDSIVAFMVHVSLFIGL